MVKDNTLQTSYPSNPATGSSYKVYFDGTTTPTTFVGPSEKSKGIMVQVSGLSSGSLDQGYTSITTSTNQNVTPTLGAFNISSFTKGTVSSSSQGASRSTTLSWGTSENATKYQVQYQGSNDNTNWTTVRAYSSTYNITGTTDTRTWSTSGGDFGYYTFMRANVRSLEDTGTATYVYSNNAAYVEASGTAPGSPSFGTLTLGTKTADIPFTVGSQGSNYLYQQVEYMYRADNAAYGTSWSTKAYNVGSTGATISLTGLTGGTKYWIKMRIRNLDELYSSEVETNFTTKTLTSPTISSVTYSTTNNRWTINYSDGAGDYFQVWYQSSNNSSSVPALSGTVNSAPDANSTSASSMTKDITPTDGYAYYFWIRASTTATGTGDGNVSDWKGPVTAVPVNTASPSLSGTTKVGNTLTFGKGTWVNATNYEVSLYRGTQYVATSETLASGPTAGISSTYVLPLSDFDDPNGRKYYRSFAKGINPSQSSALVGGTELGPLVKGLTSPGTPSGSYAFSGSNYNTNWTWTASTGGVGTITYYYQIYSAKTSGGALSLRVSSNTTGTSAAASWNYSTYGSYAVCKIYATQPAPNADRAPATGTVDSGYV